MTVVSSQVTYEGAQADGSRWCREVHAISDGSEVVYTYLTPPGFDAAPVALARAARVAEWLADSEAAENVERDGPLTMVHQTGAEFAARLREMVRNVSRERACYIAWWLLRRIAAGHVTDAQCRAVFGMTTTAWNTFKTNTLTPRSNAWAAIIAAGGA